MKTWNNTLAHFIDSDTVFSAIITIFFLVMFVTTFTMKELTTYLLPRLLSSSGFIIGLAVLIVKFRKTSRLKEIPEVTDERTKYRGINVVYTVIFTIAYFVLMQVLGFILTTALATVAFSFIMGATKRVAAIIAAICFPIVLHSLFVTLLKVRLPQGIIESILPF